MVGGRAAAHGTTTNALTAMTASTRALIGGPSAPRRAPRGTSRWRGSPRTARAPRTSSQREQARQRRDRPPSSGRAVRRAGPTARPSAASPERERALRAVPPARDAQLSPQVAEPPREWRFGRPGPRERQPDATG